MVILLLALLIGVVAGLRTFTAPAAVSWAAYLGWLPLGNTALAFLGSVWAVGILISAVLVFATAGLAARTGAEVAGKAAASAASTTSDPMDTILDTMLRSTSTAQATTPPAAGSPATRPRTPNVPTSDETRAEMSRILASSIASGRLSADNRAHLAQLVSQRSGVSQQEAEKRVDDAVNATRAAADKARRAAVLTGFVTAALDAHDAERPAAPGASRYPCARS